MIVRALVVALLLIIPSVAYADVIGPLCWVFEESDDSYRLFFIVDPANTNVASVVGRDDFETPLTGGALLGGQPPTVDVVFTVGPVVPGTAYLVRANFRLSDLGGSAVCQGVNAESSGCGAGKASAWTPVPCP
jgi:hypothetical protein